MESESEITNSDEVVMKGTKTREIAIERADFPPTLTISMTISRVFVLFITTSDRNFF